MRAPYFGLQDDIIIAPEQHVVIDGPEVEYLFSCEKVLIEEKLKTLVQNKNRNVFININRTRLLKNKRALNNLIFINLHCD